MGYYESFVVKLLLTSITERLGREIDNRKYLVPLKLLMKYTWEYCGDYLL